ncbi:hypothetical protein EJ110_NYTH48654 [Nymphaea thermarum]|nr:hypothetical protein EJ110_NYTH48654 [Nymphaea thermarum]
MAPLLELSREEIMLDSSREEITLINNDIVGRRLRRSWTDISLPNFLCSIPNMAIFFYICCSAASLLLLFPCLCGLRIFIGKSLGSKAYPPVKGTMFHLLRCLDSLYDYQTDVAAHNKTVKYLFFSHSEVHTADPQNIEYILKTNFANYDKVTNKGHLLSFALFLVSVTSWLFEAKLLSRDDDSMSNQW